jgi:polysaccharide pyruvyl transferase WcaK-like protein
MSENSQIHLYGAVTRVPSGRCDFNAKQNIRQIIDRLLFRINPTSAIDYRNYVNPGTYNLGDHAIALAVAQQINAAKSDIDINMLDWNAIALMKERAPVLIAGSGYYFIEETKMPASRISSDSQFFHNYNVAHAFYGVGVNYVGSNPKLALEDISETGRKILSQSLAQTKAISVRDATSKAILQPLTEIPIVVTGDPALFIKPILADHPPPEKSCDRLTIGINIPFHGPAASSRVSKDLKAYIQFFATLQKKTDCRFIQTIHFHSEIVVGKIMQDHGIRLTQSVGDVQALLSAYQRMDFHIGGMLHSCILSASVGTPCIGMAYDIKHQGFFDLMEQPDLCVSAEPFDPERLAAACDHLISRTREIRHQINLKRKSLELKSNEFLRNTMQAIMR